jgi:hypothetical protein
MTIVNEAGFMDRMKKVVGDRLTSVKDRALYATGDHKALGRLNFNLAKKKVMKDWHEYQGVKSQTTDATPTFGMFLDFLKYEYNIQVNSDQYDAVKDKPFDDEAHLPKFIDHLIQNGNIVVNRGQTVHKSAYKPDPKKQAPSKDTDKEGTDLPDAPTDDSETPTDAETTEEPSTETAEVDEYSIFPNENVYINLGKFKTEIKQNARTSELIELSEFLSKQDNADNIDMSSDHVKLMGVIVYAFLSATSTDQAIISKEKDDANISRLYKKINNLMIKTKFKSEYYSEIAKKAGDTKHEAISYVRNSGSNFKYVVALVLILLDYMKLRNTK